MQIIYISLSRNTVLYDGAVINAFPSSDPSFSLQCVTLNGHENPRWNADNSVLADFLSAQQNGTVPAGSANVTLQVRSSREQRLRFDGMFDMQLSGNYSCVSQTSRQSANVTLTTSELQGKT